MQKDKDGHKEVTRRRFLKGSAMLAGGLAAGGGLYTAMRRLRDGDHAGPQFFQPDQFDQLEAACERMLPADHEPGARSIGAAHYIDRLLVENEFVGDFLRWRQVLRQGLRLLEKQSQATYGTCFVNLDTAEQDALLAACPDRRFLGVLIEATLDGVFYDPFYGGNRDEAGWHMVAFNPRASFRSKILTSA
jgi:gluconate 2-dehydrogenase gamma chain